LLGSAPPFKGSGEDQGYKMLRAVLCDQPNYELITSRGVSETCITFLQSMLNIDGEFRPTAQDLLQFPWLQNVEDIVPIADFDESQLLPNPESSKLDTLHEEDEWDVLETESFVKAAKGLLPSPSPEAPDLTRASVSADEGVVVPQFPRKEEMVPEVIDSDADSASRLASQEIAAYWESLPDESGKRSVRYFDSYAADGEKRSQIPAAPIEPWFAESEELPEPQLHKLQNDIKNGVRTLPGILPTRPATGRLFGEILPKPQITAESGVFGAIEQPKILGDAEVRTEKQNYNSPSLFGAESRMDKLNVKTFHTASIKPASFANKSILKRHRSLGNESDRSITSSADEGPVTKRSMIKPSRRSSGDEVPAGTNDDDDDGTISVSQDIDALQLQTQPLGVLTPIPGSISNEPVILNTRLSNFGRDPRNTNVYPNPSETRIPKKAMDIYFYSPGKATFRGPGWHRLENLHAVIMTRSTSGIKINGVHLASSPPEGPFRCGKLKTGDIIEIYNSGRKFLAYQCEFFLGESQLERHSNEKFQVEDDSELFAAALATVNINQ
jgi:hypothetical protein